MNRNELPENFSCSDCDTWMNNECENQVSCENCPDFHLREREEDE